METNKLKWQELPERHHHPDPDLSIETKSHTFGERNALLGQKGGNRYVFFIFNNPISGSSKALTLTNLDIEKIVFSTFKPNGSNVEVNLYSLVDPDSRATGLKLLLETTKDQRAEIRVIVGGGDGSVMWAVDEIMRFGIDVTKCPIGCIPFGTGNDLSRVLGWGGQEPSVIIGKDMKNFKGLLKQWIDASSEDLDIWEVVIEVYEEGGLRRVHKPQGGGKYTEKYLTTKDALSGEEKKLQVFKKKMCNYFSFGIDAMTGYGFDKCRTTSRVLNKTIYCWEGFKRMFTNSYTVSRILHKVEELRGKDHGEHTEASTPNDHHDQSIEKIEFSGKEFLLFPAGNHNDLSPHATIIKGDPAVFLCLNIPSYMGGASNPWGASKGNVGVTDHLNKTLGDFQEQNFGDGKLEILSYSGPLALGMERLAPGQGKRVGQTEGPFQLNFRRSENPRKPLKTYMNVDGEYFQVIAPKRVTLSLSKDFPRGKVKMLVKSGFKMA